MSLSRKRKNKKKPVKMRKVETDTQAHLQSTLSLFLVQALFQSAKKSKKNVKSGIHAKSSNLVQYHQ